MGAVHSFIHLINSFMISFIHLFTQKYLLYSYYASSTKTDLEKTTGNKTDLVHTVMECRLWWNLLNEALNQYLFSLISKKQKQKTSMPLWREPHCCYPWCPDLTLEIIVYLNDSFIHSAEWHSLLPVSSRSMSTRQQELKFHGERTDTMIHFKNICALLM